MRIQSLLGRKFHASATRPRPRWLVALLPAVLSLIIAGCNSGSGHFTSGGGPSNGSNATVTLAVSDTPSSGVTILSFEATITGASLTSSSGGSATLISNSNPLTLELKRLEGDSTLAASVSVPAGTYNNLTISVANPTFTFLNNSGATITVGAVNCLNGTTCQVQPAAAANVVFATAPFPLTITANTPQSFVLDFNLNTILSSTLGVNFSAGMSVSAASGSSSTVVTSVEDQVGKITALDIAHNNFTFTTSQAAFKVNLDMNTAYQDFLSFGCSSANSGCLAVNQVVAVNMNLMGDGSLLGTSITYEDSNLDETLTEGIIFSVDSPTQFRMVVLDTLPVTQGIGPGSIATVTLSGITTYSVDDEGADTSAFSFIGSSNLVAGQEVQVKDLSTSSGTAINADRVRLRGSRWTATVSTVSSPNFNVILLPSLFTSKGFSQIQVQTSAATEFAGTTTTFTQVTTGKVVTLRGQIFLSSSALVMPASKVDGH
jgi:hypothetical protein